MTYRSDGGRLSYPRSDALRWNACLGRFASSAVTRSVVISTFPCGAWERGRDLYTDVIFPLLEAHDSPGSLGHLLFLVPRDGILCRGAIFIAIMVLVLKRAPFERTGVSKMFIYKNLIEDQLSSYREQGFVNVGRTLDDEGLQYMRDEVMRAWVAEKGPFDSDKTWLDNALLVNVHHKSDLARRYYFSGPLVDIAQQIIGPNIKSATSQLTFKMRGNNKPFDWHQDNAYGELDPYNAISTLTALDDADIENGCLWLVPGSHKEGQTNDQNTLEDNKAGKVVKLNVDDSRAVPMPIKAGECLIFHCHMLHKSEGNMSSDRDRRILFLRFADANAVEVYNDRKPRLGRLIRGSTRFPEVERFEAELPLD